MARAGVGTVTRTKQAIELARGLPPPDDELRFDLDLGEVKPRVKARAGWRDEDEGQGVKAAILRWLEQQV